MGMVGEACLPSNAYYPRTPDYTLCSGVHVCWSEHSDSSFVYGFMILDYGFGTMTATTLQKCFFGDSLPRLFKPFGFVKKHGRQGAGLVFPIYLYKKLNNSSCQKPLDQWLYNFAELFLCDSVPRLFKPFGLSKNMAARGWGLFSLYIFIENLKNLLVRNHWTNFIITWQKCFHGDPVPRLFK